MRLRQIPGIGVCTSLAVCASIYLLNASWLAPQMTGAPKITAHQDKDAAIPLFRCRLRVAFNRRLTDEEM